MFLKKMNAEEKAEILSKIEGMDETSASGLKDWAAIRVYLKKHDDEMINDHEDDINTMLVFAGLFSAVVTAFIIESYKWLEQDNSQINTQLLAQISSQLAGAPPNHTLISSAHSSSSSFHASISSIWINVLWGVSLLFSLTAALLGIIIKQWLREYLLWDSVLSHSREAVLLRHIRFDAWERWKVPEIISAIPAMLEFALVLFLCGAVILLWTLNLAVAVIVTIFGSVFFVLACAVNILPIFFHRCPYKSAVGWTCVSVWNLLSRWSHAAQRRLRSFRKRAHRATHSESRPDIHRRTSSWRQRDLQRHRQWGMDIKWDPQQKMDHEMRLEIVELVILYHALSWVCSSTQDERLLAKVQQCAVNFHGSSRRYPCSVAGMYAACQILTLDSTKFFPCLRQSYQHEAYAGSPFYGTYTLCTKFDMRHGELWQGRDPELPALRVIGDVLLNVAKMAIEDLFPENPNPILPTKIEMRGFMEMLCFLVHIFPWSSPTWQDNFVEILSKFYDNFAYGETPGPWNCNNSGELVPRYPGFRTMMFQLLARVRTVDLTSTGELQIVHALEPALPSYHMELAIQIFRNNSDYRRSEDRHLFVVLADSAICNSMQEDKGENKEALRNLLLCMDDATQLSLERRVSNCGYYGHLPWIETLLSLAQHPHPSWNGLISASLIDHLEEGVQKSLITGTGERVTERVSLLKDLVAARTIQGIQQRQPSTEGSSASDPHAWPGGIVADEKYFNEQSVHHDKLASSSSLGSSGSPYIMPPTPFSLVQGGDHDIELGELPYTFPVPETDATFFSHSRASTWPN